MAKYKLTKDGVQDIENGGFIANKDSRQWRTHEAWLAKGNTPEPMAEPQELVVDENEEKIRAEMRQIAIDSLIDKGELSEGTK